MLEKSQNRPIVFAETNFLFDCVFERDANSEYMLELAKQYRIGMFQKTVYTLKDVKRKT